MSLPFPGVILSSELVSHFPAVPTSTQVAALVLPDTLNSYQRMQIHAFVQKADPRVDTFSVGTEPDRRLVVARKMAAPPAAAPEPVQVTKATPERGGRSGRRPSRGVYVPPGRARMGAAAPASSGVPAGMTREQVQEVHARLGANVKFEMSALDVIPGEELDLSLPAPAAPMSPTSTPSPTSDFECNVLEIFDFPSEFKTVDVLKALAPLTRAQMEFRWVDDTHALAVFETEEMAAAALQMTFDLLKLRPLEEGLDESKAKAESLALLKSRVSLPRPQTSTLVARRMLSGALGVSVRLPREQERKEKELLQSAKEQKRQQASSESPVHQ